MTNTKGTVVMNSLMAGYQPLGASLQQLRNGVLIAFENGLTTPYSLETAEARGTLFVGPAQKVYAGQIIGLNRRQEDMEINVCKTKQLSNMRSKGEGGMEFLDVPLALTLEDSLEYIADDEIVEVTPKSIRIRKIDLKKGAK